VRKQAQLQAEQARTAMEDQRDGKAGGVSGWVAERAGEWDLSGQDEKTMQQQKFFWNLLVDYWFRMEIDGWENIGKPPALLIGIHSGAPFVWDAWTVGLQWWRRFGPERPLHGTAHDAPRPRTPSRLRWPKATMWRYGRVVKSTLYARGASAIEPTWQGAKAL